MVRVALVFLLGLVFCAWSVSAAEKPLTDLKAISGTWVGMVGSDHVTLLIKEDGHYQAYGQFRFDGQITLTDGQARYRGSNGRSGTVALHEDKGKPVLRFVRDAGGAYDFERAK